MATGESHIRSGPPSLTLSLFYWFAGNMFYGQSRSIKDIGLAKRMGPPL